jgi:hypothetical protein
MLATEGFKISTTWVYTKQQNDLPPTSILKHKLISQTQKKKEKQ